MDIPTRRGSATFVFVHAHPDDESLFTGGTMARLSAWGHRVVVVTATDGAAGLSAGLNDENALATTRNAELHAACAALGVDRVLTLGLPDSGLDGLGTSSTFGTAAAGKLCFAQREPFDVADQIRHELRDEVVSVVVGYDSSGGYGHPDHIQVHRVARELWRGWAGVRLLEATLPREPFAGGARLAIRAARLAGRPVDEILEPWLRAFTPRRGISYRFDNRSYVQQKHAALAAHASQSVGGAGPRTIDLLLKLPAPLFNRLMGFEYFAGPRPTRPRLRHETVIGSQPGRSGHLGPRGCGDE